MKLIQTTAMLNLAPSITVTAAATSAARAAAYRGPLRAPASLLFGSSKRQLASLGFAPQSVQGTPDVMPPLQAQAGELVSQRPHLRPPQHPRRQDRLLHFYITKLCCDVPPCAFVSAFTRPPSGPTALLCT